MDRPAFEVTNERLRAYACMFDIKVSEADIQQIAIALAGGLCGLAALRDLDIEGVEPFVVFPIDRVQSS